jgi:hypothetical protein
VADAVVIGLAKKVKRAAPSSGAEPEGEDEGEGMSLDEAEDDAVDELIGELGADKPDPGAVKSALHDFVEACIKRQTKGEY